MAEIKIRKTRASSKQFIYSTEDPQKRKDCRATAAMMRETTGARGVIWGSSVVGFGRSSYRYADDRDALRELIYRSVAAKRAADGC